MRVVPDEPTDEMVTAGHLESVKRKLVAPLDIVYIYKAMLAAHSPAADDGVEPVAWISERSLDWLKICRESGRGTKGGAQVECRQDDISTIPLYAALPSTRAEGMEEAAKICDALVLGRMKSEYFQGVENGAERCADAIRAAIRSRGE